MKLGLSSLLFLCDKLGKAVATAANLGYEAIEIVYDVPHFMPREKPEVRELRKAIKDHGLAVSVHSSFWDLNASSFYPEVYKLTLKRIKESARFCEGLDCEVLVVHSGKCPAPDSREIMDKSKMIYEKFLRELSEYCRGRGVRIGLENGGSKDSLFSLLPHLSKLTRRYGMGITLDLGHVCLRYGKDNIDKILRELRRIKDQVLHVHIHDNHWQRDEHLVPGDGALPLREMLDAIAPYSGMLIAELWNPQAPLKTAKLALRQLKLMAQR